MFDKCFFSFSYKKNLWNILEIFEVKENTIQIQNKNDGSSLARFFYDYISLFYIKL